MSQLLDDATKAGAGRTLLLIVGGLLAGGGAYLAAQGGWTQSEASAGHVVIGWGDAGAPPAGAVVLHATARVDNATAAVFGVGPVDAGFAYFRCDVVTVPVDGGKDPGPRFIAGVEIVYDDDQVDAPAPQGAQQLDCRRQGRADALFPCACSPGPTCLQPDGGPAPVGNNLDPGAWASGGGCITKTCREMFGSPGWPAECPQ